MANKQQNFDLESKKSGVECLGMTFDNDEARRAYFSERLKEKLREPEFRKTPGFPKGADEDILRMSDPPYYTACPNPFIEEFVRVYGRPHNPTEEYHREPFAVDVSVGKTDSLYKAHNYHTKVPHLAIAPSIKHYTSPGDIILDGFCGSGMTGVGVQWLNQSDEFRHRIDRKVILNDLSPYASHIGSVYNLPVDMKKAADRLSTLLSKLKREVGWMYETRDSDTGEKAFIEYVVWSEVYACPTCTDEIVFSEVAVDDETQRVADTFSCPHCQAELTKSRLLKSPRTLQDPLTSQVVRVPRRKPVLIQYVSSGQRKFKQPDSDDIERIARIEESCTEVAFPVVPIPYMHMTHERARMESHGITHAHHFFLPRQLHVMSRLWRWCTEEQDSNLRQGLLFILDHAILGMSVLNRYKPIQYGRVGGSQVNNYLDGVYYVPAQIAECSPWYNLGPRVERIPKAFRREYRKLNCSMVSTGSCTSLPIPSNSVDYVFTDPPFGENKYYSDLNFLVEAFYSVWTEATPEAIVDRAKRKGIDDYQELMRRSFAEYFRVLKPGRWMTVVFSNSSNAVWRSIQEALGTAGFVVADIRTLDKKQGSYRQVTSSAVKQDLVISAYKPTKQLLEEFVLEAGTEKSGWAFVEEHLAKVPLFVVHGGESEVIAERTPQLLFDRMIAFHVQRGVAVPMDAGDFFRGLEQRYAKRDGMYFLHEQVLEYDKKRAKVETVRQLSFDVTDEASAILWVRAELDRKPQSFQDLQPVFMRESHAWAGHERTVELKEILEENFLIYDGTGPVPAQIHTYLSTNFKDMRGLSKDDPILKAKAADRWYVPDPNKQSDLDHLRTKRLLKEFLEYRESKEKKLKQFRTEAIRAGFKAAYDQKDYRTILDVARKVPEQVIQEDEKLLMYHDVASMRLGED